MKKCSACKAALTSENSYPSSLLGKGTLCKGCNLEHTRKWRKENPEKSSAWARLNQKKSANKLVAMKLERGGCYDCGGVFPPGAMDWDHISGEKKFCVGYGASHSWDSVREEIDKCQLVCATCHRIRTASRRKSNQLVKK